MRIGGRALFLKLGGDPSLEVYLPDVVAISRNTDLEEDRTAIWIKGRTPPSFYIY
jgi:hypothetical protein